LWGEEGRGEREEGEDRSRGREVRGREEREEREGLRDQSEGMYSIGVLGIHRG
jgi:hypothetical protein